MVKIEIVVSNQNLASVTEALQDLGYRGLTVTEVSSGPGPESGTRRYRARSMMAAQRGVRVELVIPTRRLEEALELLQRVSGADAGQIVVTPVADVVRIRTGERGEDAVE
jgi:nitrogen regulatory protein P-II 1